MADIRDSEPGDIDSICALHRAAFGDTEGDEIAALVRDLLADASARPVLSLITCSDTNITGHILFTRVHIEGSSTDPVGAILAPLGILPDHQASGLGGALIRAGLDRLRKRDVDLVFVLGHPGYYPRFGFRPADELDLAAPHPIPEAHRDAWMVQALKPGILGKVAGVVRCAVSLSDPRYW